MQESTQHLKPKKIVWVMSDGIPGHFNQSKGILLALKHIYDIEVCWVEVKLKSGAFRSILALLLNHFSLPVRYFAWFYSGRLPNQPPDLVIGAGGRASFAVAWIAKAFRAESVFSGSIRHLKAESFSVILNLEANNHPVIISVPIAPMPISQSLLLEAAHSWRLTHAAKDIKFWTMLIGGNGAGAEYHADDWQALALEMNQIAARANIQWLISTSRRSGHTAEAVLQQYLDKQYVADAVWWSERPEAITSAFLGLSDVVFCSVDSMSMIMESISAMRAVIAFKPSLFLPDTKYLAAIARLEHEKLIKVQKVDQISQNINEIGQLKPLQLEPSIWLATQLKKRLKF